MNISTPRPISRRTVLRGVGAILSLPLLEAMSPATALSQSALPPMPSRAVFMYFGIGMNMREFYPIGEGPTCRLSRILKPLENFKTEMTAISGTWLERGGGHGGDYVMLTGAQGKTRTGIVNSISADQVAANVMGQDTRFPSLQLSLKRGTGYGQHMTTLSWNENGVPLAAENDPHVIFQKLFGVENMDERRAHNESLRQRGSILDLIQAQAARLQKRVSSRNQAKLDEYFTSVREVERQLERNLAWSRQPRPQAKLAGLGDYSKPFKPRIAGFSYPKYLKLMYDLMALAFQTDSTRVITFLQRTEKGEVFPCHRVSNGFHALSHHNNDPKYLAELAQVDVMNMGFLADFLQRLRSIRELDGRSLLDRSLIAFSSGMGFDHSRDRLPTAIFGGRSLGVKHHGHLKLKPNTPLSNLWRTMLDRLDVPVGENFQDSTGVITKLLA